MSYYITADAAMRYYMLAVQSGDREVGGFFEYNIDEHGNVIITALTPLRQESSECYFEIDNATKSVWLEKIVGEGKDPSNFGMFHTHPSGMSAKMSGVDVSQISEMATDLPGTIARSMILAQGDVVPMIHEAVCVDGRVFRRENVLVKMLDNTGALDDLKKIGWFDKPKVTTIIRHTGFTQPYPRQDRLIAGDPFSGKSFSNNDGWFDEAPELSESPAMGDRFTTQQYADYLDEKYIEEAEAQAAVDANDEDDAEEYIGEYIQHQGGWAKVIDAYYWDGDIVLVLPDNTEIKLDDATVVQQAV